jgi:hypothetical protein
MLGYCLSFLCSACWGPPWGWVVLIIAYVGGKIRFPPLSFLPIICYIIDMTITQTVEITDDRHVRFDYELPRDVTADKAQVIIEFPVREKPKANNEIPRFTKKEFEELMKNSPITQSLSGILSGLGDVDLDEIRMERLKKHL